MAEEIKYIKTQLNQRTESGYNILYPQTVASQVITSNEAQFVSAADKALWNEMAAKGLFYAGQYQLGENYPKNAIVLYEGKYYFALNDLSLSQAPDVNFKGGQIAANGWQALTYQAYYADKAGVAEDSLKLNGKEESALEVAKAAEADNAAKLNNKEEKDLRVAYAEEAGNAAKLGGKAANELTVAEAVVASEYRIDENSTANINEKFEYLAERIQTAADKNIKPLTIKIEGKDDTVFDGLNALSTPVIKQNYGYADIAGLMKDGRIDPALLPDSVVGQLEYMGTWSAKVDGYVPAKGQYFIAGAEVSVNPDGSTAAATYHVGDWAVYNGTSWDKIDNTDEVTLVNGQKGAVETYKGNYKEGEEYFKGDIVKNGDKYYICVVSNKDSAWVADNWGMLGATYSGVEGNPVVVEGFNVKHASIEAVTENAEDKVLNQNSTLIVPVISRDEYGHITKITNQKYSLDASSVDTVRPIKIKGTEIYSDKVKTALDLAGDTYIDVADVNGQVTFSHKTNTNVIGDLKVEAVEKLQAGQSFYVPSIEIDGAGHVTNAELKEVKLGEASIAHELFEVKTVNNVQTIGAYKGIDNIANVEALKFYQGAAVPTATDALKLNGAFAATELYQGANKVLDSGLKVYGGQKEVPSSVNPGTFTKEDILGEIKDGRMELGNSGIAEGVYSVVKVNAKGIATAGGQIVEFGSAVNAGPSDSLAVGGLFFRKVEEISNPEA